MDQKIKRAVKCTSPLHGWSVAPPGKFKFFILAEAGRYGANDAYEVKHWRGDQAESKTTIKRVKRIKRAKYPNIFTSKKRVDFEKFCRSDEWK